MLPPHGRDFSGYLLSLLVGRLSSLRQLSVIVRVCRAVLISGDHCSKTTSLYCRGYARGFEYSTSKGEVHKTIACLVNVLCRFLPVLPMLWMSASKGADHFVTSRCPHSSLFTLHSLCGAVGAIPLTIGRSTCCGIRLARRMKVASDSSSRQATLVVCCESEHLDERSIAVARRPRVQVPSNIFLMLADNVSFGAVTYLCVSCRMIPLW